MTKFSADDIHNVAEREEAIIYALDEESSYYRAQVDRLMNFSSKLIIETPFIGCEGGQRKVQATMGGHGGNDDTDSDSCSVSLLSIPSNE